MADRGASGGTAVTNYAFDENGRDLATTVFGRQFTDGQSKVWQHESAPSPGVRNYGRQRVLPWVTYAVVRQLCAQKLAFDASPRVKIAF